MFPTDLIDPRKDQQYRVISGGFCLDIPADMVTEVEAAKRIAVYVGEHYGDFIIRLQLDDGPVSVSGSALLKTITKFVKDRRADTTVS